MKKNTHSLQVGQALAGSHGFRNLDPGGLRDVLVVTQAAKKRGKEARQQILRMTEGAGGRNIIPQFISLMKKKHLLQVGQALAGSHGFRNLHPGGLRDVVGFQAAKERKRSTSANF